MLYHAYGARDRLRKDLNRDPNAILAAMYDEILVVDQYGTLLRRMCP
ncbi:hypothetical protein [Salibacterium sp. K-3]